MNDSKQIDDGGPAYPVSTRKHNNDDGYGHQDGASTWQFGGMSLRDHFAGLAMQGWAANGQLKIEMKENGPFGTIANWSYQVADAMLLARKAGAK